MAKKEIETHNDLSKSITIDGISFVDYAHWWKPRETKPRLRWLNQQINSL